MDTTVLCVLGKCSEFSLVFGKIVGWGRRQRRQLGQMTKDLEGLAKQVGLGSSCGDLGSSQREEAQEMGKGA